ncbi:hypothetical protein IFM89_013637 [Coptis chinensis]|uniref:Uncharacterized protein n=1 Tax=Coptis chinensis TaxID=261450 RepID=A0A835IMC6_9MAGN|nr:hypothetical protein IFM89_013637 [Coptis chinensis]
MTGVVDSGPKPFRFHDMWCKDVSCEGVIENCWSHLSLGSPSFILNSKFKFLRTSLRTWNREVFGNIFTQIKESETKLTSLISEHVTDVNLLEIKEMRKNIMDLYQKEQLYWKHISHSASVLDADNNTKFFHSFASFRRRRNVSAIPLASYPWVTVHSSQNPQSSVLE